MTSPINQELSEGRQLFDAGWRQGSLFQAPAIDCVWIDEIDGDGKGQKKSKTPKQKDLFVLVTQDCDIVAKDDDEPRVEALLCKIETKQVQLARWDQNSARLFVIDFAQGIVAQAKYRAHISKKVLRAFQPNPWPSDAKRFERFVRWLARRYDRPAVADRLVEVFENRVRDTLHELTYGNPEIVIMFSQAIHEVRVNVPGHEDPPYNLQLLLMVRHQGISAEEHDAILLVMDRILKNLDPELVHLNPEPLIGTEAQVSMELYFATRPLYLEYHTYNGDEMNGAEPLIRA